MVATKLRHRYINRQTNSQTVYHKTNDDKFVEGSDYKDDCALNVLKMVQENCLDVVSTTRINLFQKKSKLRLIAKGAKR